MKRRMLPILTVAMCLTSFVGCGRSSGPGEFDQTLPAQRFPRPRDTGKKDIGKEKERPRLLP